MTSGFFDWFAGRIAEWSRQWVDRTLRARIHHCGRGVTIYHPVAFHGPEALDIGDNTSIAHFVHIWCGGRVIIGASCMIGSHVSISSLTHDHREPEMIHTMVAKPVVIEDGVWIGSHAVILPGVTLGRGSVIGAGSVVTRDVPPLAIAYGVPAKVMGYRETQG